MYWVEVVATFSIFGTCGYIFVRRESGVGHHVRQPQYSPNWSLAGWSVPDFQADDPSRLLLRLADLHDRDVLGRRLLEDERFAAEVNQRRDQILWSYSSGRLPPDIRSACIKTLLEASGASSTVEIHKILLGLPVYDQRHIGVRRLYITNKLAGWWHRWTVAPVAPLSEGTEGPCLLIGSPKSSDESLAVQGSITHLSDRLISVDLGSEHGIFAGDVLQIERNSDGEWIGCAIVQATGTSSSEAAFMGENVPHTGDRAKTVITHSSLWEPLYD